MTETVETTIEDVTYIGRRWATGDRLLPAYVNAEGRVQLYTKPLVAGYQPGVIVRIHRPVDVPDSYYTAGVKGPKVIGQDDDEEKVRDWRAEDRANAQIKAGADAAKKANKEAAPEFEAAIVTLRGELDRLKNRQQRAALHAYIVAAILA